MTSYAPPDAQVGDVLFDEMLGEEVRVVAIRGRRIRWPQREPMNIKGPRRKYVPILCGDLVRATVEESEKTVAELWGVPVHYVKRWRRAIAGLGPDDTDVSIHTALVLKRQDPEFRKRFYAASD
jgi:hypothetical protein